MYELYDAEGWIQLNNCYGSINFFKYDYWSTQSRDYAISRNGIGSSVVHLVGYRHSGIGADV